MYKLSRTILAVVLASWAFSAHAWWGPFLGWFEDFFGSAGGGFDFSVSMQANGGGWGRHYGYGGPYAYPYPGLPSVQGYPYAPSPHIVAKAANEEAQDRQLRQDVEAQRLLADRMARQQQRRTDNAMAHPSHPFSGFDPFSINAKPVAGEPVLPGQREDRPAPVQQGGATSPVYPLADADKSRI
jgi:hypothetical protein